MKKNYPATVSTIIHSPNGTLPTDVIFLVVWGLARWDLSMSACVLQLFQLQARNCLRLSTHACNELATALKWPDDDFDIFHSHFRPPFSPSLSDSRPVFPCSGDYLYVRFSGFNFQSQER